MTNFNIAQFEDEFGNIKNKFEVVKYEKLSNGEWVECERFESGRRYFVIEDQLYYISGDSKIKLNMDFNSEDCGMCYQIGNSVDNDKKITENEIIFTVDSNIEEISSLSLHKQSYSDGTCFYTLQDQKGNWKYTYGNRDISELIKQLEHEITIAQSRRIGKTCDEFERIKIESINKMKLIA